MHFPATGFLVQCVTSQWEQIAGGIISNKMVDVSPSNVRASLTEVNQYSLTVISQFLVHYVTTSPRRMICRWIIELNEACSGDI